MTNVNSAAGADRVEKKINVVKKFDCLQLCPEVMFVMFNSSEADYVGHSRGKWSHCFLEHISLAIDNILLFNQA